jgi:hypothetical protein
MARTMSTICPDRQSGTGQAGAASPAGLVGARMKRARGPKRVRTRAMRAPNRLGAVLIVYLSATAIAHASPGDVYSDFAQDGVLACTHSRADLSAVLRSGSLNQYGDPYTLTRLKLEVRRQLAGGCRSRGAAGTGASGKRTTTSTPSKRGKDVTHRAKDGKARTRSRASQPRSTASSTFAKDGDKGFVFERALIAGLLVGVLAVGGWLTRRAFVSSD